MGWPRAAAFPGRFKTVLMQAEEAVHLATLSTYIHLFVKFLKSLSETRRLAASLAFASPVERSIPSTPVNRRK